MILNRAVQPKLADPLRRPAINIVARKSVVQRMEAVGQRNVRLTSIQLDQAYGEIKKFWKSRSKAGSQADNDLESEDTHGCSSRATLTDGRVLTGTFSSEECHAEMDVVGKLLVVSGGRNPAGLVRTFEIEKEPCPRCAVVLNMLGLAGLVTYKNSGQKDYPTWRFPDAIDRSTQWVILQAGTASEDERDKDEIVTKFRTQKWW